MLGNKKITYHYLKLNEIKNINDIYIDFTNENGDIVYIDKFIINIILKKIDNKYINL